MVALRKIEGGCLGDLKGQLPQGYRKLGSGAILKRFLIYILEFMTSRLPSSFSSAAHRVEHLKPLDSTRMALTEPYLFSSKEDVQEGPPRLQSRFIPPPSPDNKEALMPDPTPAESPA